MKSERWKLLMEDYKIPLTNAEQDEGWHFCNEFDGLLVKGDPKEKVCGDSCIKAECNPFGLEERPSKPPLGITPRYVVEYQRRLDLIGAIHRYISHADSSIPFYVPREWIEELLELNERFKANEK